jgi:two-component system, OmpR family, sensor histidine kinase ChvG
MRERARTFLSRMWVRVLAFNVLIVFLPIAGMLSLDTYEKQLLRSLERSLVQQGRVLAAALEDSGPRLRQNTLRVLEHMRQRHDARLRVVDAHGLLLADSASIAPTAPESSSDGSPAEAASRLPSADTTAAGGAGGALGGAAGAPGGTPGGTPAVRTAQETFLYRLASFPVRLWRKYLHPPQPPAESDEYYAGAKVLGGQEIKDALAGGYGAVTRVSAGQQSLTLYSAIPVPDRGRIVGAVLVSQSTYRMLSDLYALRLDIFRLFLWSVITAVVLSLLVSATITVPIRRLRDQAHAILDPRGRLLGGIVASRARDEVGELSRSLGELTARLQRHVRQMESFASDVSHEFKNPLASIRSAAEIANSSADPAERRAMLAMVLEDVSRLERLLTGVREISRIDSGAAEAEGGRAVDVKEIAARVVSSARRRGNGGEVTFVVEGEGAAAWIPPGRLEQVVENLVDNAVSFSPAGGVVKVTVGKDDGFAVLRVSDQGPGVPSENRGRIFDRFFSFRPGEKKGTHAGLGLSIVKAIAESHGGAVGLADPPPASPQGSAGTACGACFVVRLPSSGPS